MSSLLPVNSTALERALEQTGRLDHLSPEVIRSLWNPATCPEDLLPWLAWALSVDFWNDSWPIERQRAVIAGSIAWHRKKGTPWAVEQALSAIGYSDSRLIEHQELYQEWITAGGELLDGATGLDGDSDLSSPLASIRFSTRSWAEYSVRLNIGDIDWSRAHQREAVAVCNAYAPARSQLVALIVAAVYQLDSRILMDALHLRAKIILDRCRRFVVPAFDTLDGCDLIGGDNDPEYLDGASNLLGDSPLNGYTPIGEPLDSGQLGIQLRAQLALAPFVGGGSRVEMEYLYGGHQLDGHTTIAGDTLDGYGQLDGDTLYYPNLFHGDERLDATSRLGLLTGPDCIHFGGLIRTWRGSSVTQEPLHDTQPLTRQRYIGTQPPATAPELPPGVRLEHLRLAFECGGDRVGLAWPNTLEGRYRLADETLDGTDRLSGGLLWYPSLTDTDERLDGTDNLGLLPGPEHINYTGVIRQWRGSHLQQEPL